MRLHQFDSYDKYLETQVRGSHYRINRRPSANLLEFGRIANYLRANDRQTTKFICHGARCGTEVRLFKDEFPIADVFGTDLFAKDPSCVIEWDFHKSKPEWLNAFDVVYSNTLDHSPEPLECLHTWISQLKPTGLLFLTWSPAHELEDRPQLPFPGGDCFGARLEEYLDLLRQLGKVHDLLWCEVGRGQIVIVTGPSPVQPVGRRRRRGR